MRKEDRNTVVLVTNMTEDVGASYVDQLKPGERGREVYENAELSWRGALALPTYKKIVVVSPSTIDPEFIRYIEQLLDRDIQVLTPNQIHEGRISIEALNDDWLLQVLSYVTSTAMFAAYCPSPELYLLIDALAHSGSVKLLNLPEKYSDEAFMEIGGKIGIRRFMDTQSNRRDIFHMAEGIICENRTQLIETAMQQYLKWGGVVVKTQKGHAGAGVEIFRPGLSVEELYSQLEGKLIQGYWNVFPSVVERYIEVNHEIAGGFPNAEFVVLEDGSVELEYFCGMLVNDKGVFSGVMISGDILTQEQQNFLYVTGKMIGKNLSEKGYRGKFEVDCIAGWDNQTEKAAGKNAKIFVTEVNVRRNGGTEVYEVAKYLNGGTLDGISVLSENDSPIVAGKVVSMTFPQIQQRLSRLLYDEKKKKGIIITGAGLAQTNGTFGYMIIGKDQDDVRTLQKEMFAALEK